MLFISPGRVEDDLLQRKLMPTEDRPEFLWHCVVVAGDCKHQCPCKINVIGERPQVTTSRFGQTVVIANKNSSQ